MDATDFIRYVEEQLRALPRTPPPPSNLQTIAALVGQVGMTRAELGSPAREDQWNRAMAVYRVPMLTPANGIWYHLVDQCEQVTRDDDFY